MSKVNIQPIAGTNNRVVVQAAPAEEKTLSGIIIPDSAKEKPQQGKDAPRKHSAAGTDSGIFLPLTILPALVSLESESHKNSSPPMFRRLPAGSQEGRSSHLAALV